MPRSLRVTEASERFRLGTFQRLKSPLLVGGACMALGVRIGANMAVGGRAVVVEDTPMGVVVAGNPARQVGKRFSQNDDGD